ncbi:MAG: AraC family transcriptional regulator [Clostridiales bacterium]|nr:AraC family transcriptional regulator [Clostridiales bacterium]
MKPENNCSNLSKILYQNNTVHFKNNSIFFLEHASKNTILHWHDAVELIYIIKGTIEFNFNSETFTASDRELIFVNANTIHSFNHTSTTADYYFLVVENKFLKNNNLYSETAFFEKKLNDEESLAFFEKIIKESQKNDDFSNIAITSTIMSLFVHLNRKYLTKPNLSKVASKQLELVKSTLTYINENYKEKLKVEDVANQLYFSKSYLSHTFKKVTGISIIDYINLVKCQTAKTLILNGLEILEAAKECGFTDFSYFTRVFKKTLGILPSNVKK